MTAAGNARPTAVRALFVSPRGSDAAPCSQARPCAGLDRAYGLARPGTVVYLAGGRYGKQTIEQRGRRSGPAVSFRPRAGAKVVVSGTLTIRASRLEFRGLTLDDLELPREASHVTFRNVRDHGIWMEGPSDISYLGGEITCGTCPFHSHLDDGGPPDYRPPRRILFDHVFFHDWQAADPGQHTECLQILSGDGITIRNSTFKNCGTANGGRGATADLHVSWFGNGPVTRNVLLQNNFFYPSGNTYAIQMDDYQNVDLRYNSISGPVIVFDRDGPGTGMDFVGNIMRFAGCSAENSPVRIHWRYNVLQGGKCGPTDRNAPSGFVNPASNLHLRRGAAAIGRGDPRLFPGRDIDGQKRPVGRRPDAGADERR